MQNILKGLTIIEGSAFIAAPSGGMTVAQLGADVIRFDQIGFSSNAHLSNRPTAIALSRPRSCATHSFLTGCV